MDQYKDYGVSWAADLLKIACGPGERFLQETHVDILPSRALARIGLTRTLLQGHRSDDRYKMDPRELHVRGNKEKFAAASATRPDEHSAMILDRQPCRRAK